MSALHTASRTPTKSASGAQLVSRATLKSLGIDVDALFRHRTIAFRPVEEVSTDGVGVRVGSALAWFPTKALPRVRFAQWLRFELEGDHVRISVDLSATLRAEMRWSNLFDALLGT